MSDQSGGDDLEQAIKPLHDGFEACEDFCRRTDSDLPDDAEVFVRGARRSSFGLFTYGDLRKLLSAVPVGSQGGGDQGTQDGAEANGWRPIDEVKGSGDVFLLYHPPIKSGRSWLGEMVSVGRPWEKPMRPPSHYQPLPPAPALINPPSQEDRDA